MSRYVNVLFWVEHNSVYHNHWLTDRRLTLEECIYLHLWERTSENSIVRKPQVEYWVKWQHPHVYCFDTHALPKASVDSLPVFPSWLDTSYGPYNPETIPNDNPIEYGGEDMRETSGERATQCEQGGQSPNGAQSAIERREPT